MPSARRFAPERDLPRLGLYLLVVVAGLWGVSGCAWNYAAQETPADESASESKDDSPNVVEVEEKSTSESTASGASQSGPDAGESQPSSPCGVQTFAIHYYDKSRRVTKRIDCLHRKVVSVNRTPISQERLRAAEKAGLPQKTWYLLVDPKGIRSKFLNKDQLMNIQREFELNFLGRDSERNLLIYEYNADL